MGTPLHLNIPAYSDALVVLGTAAVLIPLFRRWGVNPVLGYLAAGALLGPFGLGAYVTRFRPLYWFTISNTANIAGIAELGVVFLLFVIGLELSPQRLAALGRLVGGFGTLQVVLCTVPIAAVVAAIGEGLPAAIIVGASLSLSSTAIVLEILARQNRLSTHAGRATFAVLLAQDLAAIPILMFVSVGGMTTGASIAMGLFKALLQAALAIGVMAAFGSLLLRPLFRLVAAARSAELFIAAVLFVIVGTGVVAYEAGLSMALGAFIAGLLLAETEFSKAIQASIDPFKGLLLGVFFFTVGTRVDLRDLVQEPVALIACVLGLILLKAVVITGLGKLFRLSWPSAIETGLLLGPGGEFAFVVIGMAADLGLVGRPLAGFALTVTSVTMGLTPLLSGGVRRVFAARETAYSELPILPTGHSRNAIVVGYGRVGKAICELLARNSIAHIATDYDHNVAATRNRGQELYFGDATNPEFLRACGLEQASGVIITIDSRESIDTIVAHVRSVRPDIPIVARARDADHARHLYRMGASEAVPETIEASLQLAEAALIGLGMEAEAAMASVQRQREELRRALHRSRQLKSTDQE